jgi:hypothetical protein
LEKNKQKTFINWVLADESSTGSKEEKFWALFFQESASRCFRKNIRFECLISDTIAPSHRRFAKRYGPQREFSRALSDVDT